VQQHLLVCNLEEQTVKEHSVRSPSGWMPDQFHCSFCNVVCCNTNLIMVVGGVSTFGEVLKIDVESFEVVDSSIISWPFDACPELQIGLNFFPWSFTISSKLQTFLVKFSTLYQLRKEMRSL
jgi:hypothetical protein